MFCTNCGNQVTNPNATFCNNCGSKLETPQAPRYESTAPSGVTEAPRYESTAPRETMEAPRYESATPRATTGGRKGLATVGVLVGVALVIVLLVNVFGGGGRDAPRNGSYRSEGIIPQVWTFSGSNDITMSVGGVLSASGTWRINGNRLTVTASMFGFESTSTYTITDITRNSFRIDGELFVRQ